MTPNELLPADLAKGCAKFRDNNINSITVGNLLRGKFVIFV